MFLDSLKIIMPASEPVAVMEPSAAKVPLPGPFLSALAKEIRPLKSMTDKFKFPCAVTLMVESPVISAVGSLVFERKLPKSPLRSPIASSPPDGTQLNWNGERQVDGCWRCGVEKCISHSLCWRTYQRAYQKQKKQRYRFHSSPPTVQQGAQSSASSGKWKTA
jgi:hypothetical protein